MGTLHQGMGVPQRCIHPMRGDWRRRRALHHWWSSCQRERSNELLQHGSTHAGGPSPAHSSNSSGSGMGERYAVVALSVLSEKSAGAPMLTSGKVGRRAHADIPSRRTLASLVSSTDSASACRGTPHGPIRDHLIASGRMLGGRRVDAANRATWQIATLRRRPQSLALPGDVTEAMAAQATLWQPTSRNTVRVGETVEASILKHCRDPPDL